MSAINFVSWRAEKARKNRAKMIVHLLVLVVILTFIGCLTGLSLIKQTDLIETETLQYQKKNPVGQSKILNQVKRERDVLIAKLVKINTIEQKNKKITLLLDVIQKTDKNIKIQKIILSDKKVLIEGLSRTSHDEKNFYKKIKSIKSIKETHIKIKNIKTDRHKLAIVFLIEGKMNVKS